jgi:hypothetical protein
MDDAELRDLATKRLKARTDFYHYLLVWLGVSLLTSTIWLLTAGWGTYFWPGWVIGGMGIAAFFQAISVFGPVRGVYSDDKITQEMNKLRGSPGSK